MSRQPPWHARSLQGEREWNRARYLPPEQGELGVLITHSEARQRKRSHLTHPRQYTFSASFRTTWTRLRSTIPQVHSRGGRLGRSGSVLPVRVLRRINLLQCNPQVTAGLCAWCFVYWLKSEPPHLIAEPLFATRLLVARKSVLRPALEQVADGFRQVAAACLATVRDPLPKRVLFREIFGRGVNHDRGMSGEPTQYASFVSSLRQAPLCQMYHAPA
jgi:hypothetical protein